MLHLALHPLHADTRDEESARLAAVLEPGFDRTGGLSYAGIGGEAGNRRVECAGTDAVAVVGILLAVLRSGRWAGCLVVAGESCGPEGGPLLDEATVSALLRRAGRSSGRVAVKAPARAESEAALVEASLQLLGVLERRRSEQQQEAGRLVEAGASQREAAAVVGVSQQAVHDRLKNGLWHETRSLAAAVAVVLERLAAGDGPST